MEYKNDKGEVVDDEISLCPKCHCMTYDVKEEGTVWCGKCYETKKVI